MAASMAHAESPPPAGTPGHCRRRSRKQCPSSSPFRHFLARFALAICSADDLFEDAVRSRLLAGLLLLAPSTPAATPASRAPRECFWAGCSVDERRWPHFHARLDSSSPTRLRAEDGSTLARRRRPSSPVDIVAATSRPPRFACFRDDAGRRVHVLALGAIAAASRQASRAARTSLHSA